MSLPTYPGYKDSGVDWLGTVPEHWDSKRLKFLFDLVKREIREEDRIVTCFRDGAVTLRDNRRTDGFTNAVKEIGYQGIRVGDLVIHAMDAFAGAIGVSDSDGKSTPVYSVCTPVSPSVSSNYYARLLRNMAVAGFVSSLAKGIRERSTDFRWADAGEIFLPVPSETEQRKIVSFLDHETARIDALIEEQQRLIELLKEKRQAVISNAVTKGLDPTVPLKDSGVEWLGEVPEHWEITQIKRRCDLITDGAHISPETENGVYCFVSTRDVSDEGIDFEGCLRTSADSYEYLVRTGCQPEVGDVLFSKDGTIGRTIVVGEGSPEFVVASSLIIIRPSREELLPSYLDFLCQSWVVSQQVDGFVKGAGLPRLSIQNLTKVVGVFPPLEEQVLIADFLQMQSVTARQLTSEALRTMELLKERRSALISAAVTGKIDVRGWQPSTSVQVPILEEAV